VITDFLAFAEGPLLWIVFVLFGTGLLLRTVFFGLCIIRRRPSLNRHPAFNARPFLILRLLLPFHNAFLKKPLYSLLRYVFHICLFVVPIWLAGHISLWEGSRFEWYWTPLGSLLLFSFAQNHFGHHARKRLYPGLPVYHSDGPALLNRIFLHAWQFRPHLFFRNLHVVFSRVEL
jgi:hypothetical protein